jgi:AAA15 family ATPase/GTPase
MLIRFCVENYRSFRDRVELSLVAGEGKRHPEHVISPGLPGTPAVLKAAVLYGANASGKSNLVKAIEVAKQIILQPAAVGARLPVIPFKLDASSRSRPSRFEFEIRRRERCFAYGFVVSAERVHEEWLHEIGAADIPLFERTDGEVKFSNLPFNNDEEKQFLQFVAKGTLPNRLFLSECRERNARENVTSASVLFDVLQWFESRLTVVLPEFYHLGLETLVAVSPVSGNQLAEVLRACDTGIDGIRLEKVALSEIPLSDAERAVILGQLDPHTSVLYRPSPQQRWLINLDEQKELQGWELTFQHHGSPELPSFTWSEESDGTRRILDLAPALLTTPESDQVFVIDEFDRSLHPQVAHSLLAAFFRHNQGRQNQVIVTTHETTLLRQDFLRRDEIWFVEKGKDQASRLVALEEYRDVPPNGDLQTDYLNGRFGGVPVLLDLE